MRLLLLLTLSLFLTGLSAQTIYYSKSTGSLNVLATWGTNADGTGTAPANFTSANCTYNAVNNLSPTLSGNWTVSGANSKVVIGSAVQSVNFTVPSPRTVNGTFTVTANSTLTAASGSNIGGINLHVYGTLINASTNNPTFSTIASGSLVNYSSTGAQTIVNTTYSNLSTSGSGAKSLANTGNTTVTNSLSLGAGTTFALNTNTARTCILNGTISGSGTITGDANSNLTIGGSGTFGTITFTSGFQTIRNLIINRGAAGRVSLGSSLIVDNIFTLTNGTILINANTLTFNGAVTFPASSANGGFTGSASSNLAVVATSLTNSAIFTAGGQTLNNLTLDCGNNSFNLGTSLTVNGTYTQSSGIMNLNGQTLTLNGVVVFATLANGSTSGSNTSNLIVNATNITNRFIMTAGSQTLNNLTVNSPGRTFRIGSPVTVVGAYTHTAGIIRIGGQALTLNGTAVFPASSANGTLRGNNTATLTVNCSSITNPLAFTTGFQSMRNINFNSPGQTFTLGSNVTLSGPFNHTAGFFSIASNTLTLNGTISFPASSASGNFTGSSNSVLTIGGAGAITNSMYMNQSGTGNYMKDVTFNRGGRTLTLGNTLKITGALTPSAGTVASAGNLLLLASSSTSVGRIATIGGSVTGNITAQNYAKGGKTGWTLLGSPGLTGRTWTEWDDNTTITCASCPDGFSNSFTSVYWYDETVGGLYNNPTRYKPISNITNAMTMGRGYWVYLGTSTINSADILLDAVGPVNQGNFAFSLTRTSTGGGTDPVDHGFNLISNPYPSPIQWSLLRNGNANVANAIYVYNPDLSGYAAFVNGISSPAIGSGGVGNSIPAGQAFYVKLNAPTATLTAQESNKTASTQELLKLNGQVQSTSNPMLMRLKVNGHGMKHEAAVYFSTGATVNYDDEYDARYMGTTIGYLGISTLLNGEQYTINGLPPLTQNYSIPVKVTTDSTDTYSVSASDLQNLPSGACIILHDNYTGLDKDLRTGAYSCTVRDTEKIAARFVLNITINNNLLVNGNSQNPQCLSSGDGYLTALAAGTGPWNYYWKDANNNIIKTSLNKAGADTLFNLDAGVYSVDVNTAGSCDNGTMNFTLLSQNAAQASYTVASSSVVFVSDSVGVSFGNTSTNAVSYWWDFGDGTGASCVDTTYQYGGPGDFVVTLYAINTCGDTAVYSQLINVIDGSSMGIADIAADPAKNLYISRDAHGYYAKFNYTEPTNARINVTNMLGQSVSELNEKNLTSDKVYISLGNDGNKILVISVITERGDKIFVKIVNY